MKYYFITYQGLNRTPNTIPSIWHDVINKSPMQFIKDMIKKEDEAAKENKSYYYDFHILNTLEITEDEYNEWCSQF